MQLLPEYLGMPAPIYELRLTRHSEAADTAPCMQPSEPLDAHPPHQCATAHSPALHACTPLCISYNYMLLHKRLPRNCLTATQRVSGGACCRSDRCRSATQPGGGRFATVLALQACIQHEKHSNSISDSNRAAVCACLLNSRSVAQMLLTVLRRLPRSNAS